MTNFDGITHHARKRLKQRGFSHEDIYRVLDYGISYHAGSGCVAFWLTRRAVTQARRFLGIRLDDLMNTAVIITDLATIASIYRVKRRPHHWRMAKHAVVLGGGGA